ncbi:MAG: FprA family A-type flavoprotein [Candidatus Omnitrophica bacterium]|nr:FprA family A-type flavoprotein [Candidatus Omnitrophota bacterium]
MHKIADGIYWTGAVDWNLRNFHGYSTSFGSTYNSYLIMDEKPTLIDTVKAYGFDEMLQRIKAVIDPSKIQYIVSNHTEMDHSGNIERMLEYCPHAEVVCSPKGEEHLKRHFPPAGRYGKKDWKFRVVNTGDTLSIGKRELTFFLTPMVHWPDNMVTYSASDNILFSNDAFGQHYASHERFADEVGLDVIFHEAAKYYGNIVMPYGTQVLPVLDALSTLRVDTICPSHGLIWRRGEDIKKIVSLYRRWASHETDNKVVIVYDTMWHSTEKMARRFYELINNANIPVVIMNLQDTHISDVVTEILSSKILLIGSPILNNRMLPTMASLLMYLKGLRPKKRHALTFGSYGWATVGFKELETSLTEAGFELISEGVYKKFIPDSADIEALSVMLPTIKKVLQKNNAQEN